MKHCDSRGFNALITLLTTDHFLDYSTDPFLTTSLPRGKSNTSDFDEI